MAVVLTGTFIWTSFKYSVQGADGETLPDGLNLSSYITERTAFGIDKDGNFIYGAGSTDSLQSVLQNNSLSADPDDPDYVTEGNVSNYISAISKYLDQSRFSSAYNMVDYLNDNFNLGISKTKVVNGKTQSITDVEAITRAIIAVQKWEAANQLNTLKLLEYVNLQQAINYVRTEQLKDYVNTSKLVQYIQLDALGTYALSLGIKFNDLTNNGNWDIQKICGQLNTKMSLSLDYTTSVSDIINTVAAKIQENKETLPSYISDSINAGSITAVQSYLRKYLIDFSADGTFSVKIGTYINLQSLITYLYVNASDETEKTKIKNANSIRDVVDIMKGNEAYAADVSAWINAHSEYLSWTNNDLGKQDVSKALMELISLINKKIIDDFYKNGTLELPSTLSGTYGKTKAEEDFIIAYAKVVNTLLGSGTNITNFNEAKTYLVSGQTGTTVFGDLADSEASKFVEKLFTGDGVKINSAYVSVNEQEISPANAKASVIRQWLANIWSNSTSNIPAYKDITSNSSLFTSVNEIWKTNENELLYAIKQVVIRDSIATYSFDYSNGVDIILDLTSVNTSHYLALGNITSPSTLRSRLAIILPNLYKNLLGLNKSFSTPSTDAIACSMVNSFSRERFVLNSFDTIFNYINGYNRNVLNLDKVYNLDDVSKFVNKMPNITGITKPDTATPSLHTLFNYFYNANKYGSRDRLTAFTFASVKQYMATVDGTNYKVDDSLNKLLRQMISGGKFGAITLISAAHGFLKNANTYQYASEYTVENTESKLPNTITDIIVANLKTIEAAKGANANNLDYYSSTSETFLASLKDYITQYYGFQFHQGEDSENWIVETFNLIQIIQTKNTSYDYSNKSFDNLVNEANSGADLTVDSYNRYRQAIAEYNKNATIKYYNDSTTVKFLIDDEQATTSYTNLQNWLTGPLRIEGPINKVDNGKQDLTAIVNYLVGLGYNVNLLPNATDINLVDTVKDIILKLSNSEKTGMYSPNVKDVFDFGNTVMLNNAEAGNKTEFASGVTVDNVYLQFGQKYSGTTINQRNNLYLTSLSITATLNGVNIKVDNPMIQANANGSGFSYASNVSRNYYWYQYFDLKNIYTLDNQSTAGTKVNDTNGYYTFKFEYQYTIADGETASSDGTTSSGGTYTLSFYMFDNVIYYNSFPNFSSNTVEDKTDKTKNSIITIFNNNQTQDDTTLTLDPSLFSLTMTQKDISLVSHSYRTVFEETTTSSGTMVARFSVFRDNTLQSINTPLTEITYYADENGTLSTENAADLVKVATVRYGTANTALVNRNNGDGGLRNAPSGENSTYTITIHNANYYPGTGNKLFNNKTSYYPDVQLKLTEAGEYNIETQYLLRNRTSSGNKFIYSSVENTEKIFATNFNYNKNRENYTPSVSIDPHFSLYNFGVSAYFNKLDGERNKLELRDYVKGIRSDYSYILNNKKYFNESSFTEDGIKLIKSLTGTEEKPGNTIDDIYKEVLKHDAPAGVDAKTLFAFILDAKGLVPNTNMPTISFEYLAKYAFDSSAPKSTVTRYTSPTVSSSSYFKKDTALADAGLYIVNVVYTYDNYPKQDSNTQELSQTFIFRISSGEPEVTLYTADGTPITDNPYTNQDVYVKWNKATYFQYEYEIRYITTGDTYGSFGRSLTPGSQIDADGKMISQEFSANGRYQVSILYGNSASTGNTSKTTREFIIDKMDISNIQTWIVGRLNGSYSIAKKFQGSKYLDAPFTISYDGKLSGAKIEASFREIPLTNFSKYGEVLGTVAGSQVFADYVTTNYKLNVKDIFTTPETSDFLYNTSSSYSQGTELGSDLVLGRNRSSLFIFTITDQAGNTAQYFVLYDLTKPYVNVSPELKNSFNIVSDTTTIFWGGYKAIFLDDTDFNPNDLLEPQKTYYNTLFNSTFFNGGIGSNVRMLQHTPLNGTDIPTQTSDLTGQDVSLNGKKYIIIPNKMAEITANVTGENIEQGKKTLTTEGTWQNHITIIADDISGDYFSDANWFKGEKTYTYSITSDSNISDVNNDAGNVIYSKKNLSYNGKIQMNFDNSQGKLFNGYGTTYTLGETEAYNLDQLIFAFLPGVANKYQVEYIKYYYYALDPAQALLNSTTWNGSYFGNNSVYRPLFPFVDNSVATLLYSYLSPDTNKYKTESDGNWYSNCINPEYVGGKAKTKDGMYVFERKYVDGTVLDGKDKETRFYVCYVDKGQILSLDYTQSEDTHYNYSNGYDISFVLGRNEATKIYFTADDIYTMIINNRPSLFETNRLPVAFNLPNDKYNTANAIDERIAALQAAGNTDEANRLAVLKADILARNLMFKLNMTIKIGDNQISSTALEGLRVDGEGRSTYNLKNEGKYSIELTSGYANEEASLKAISLSNTKFTIKHEQPNGTFYGNNSDGSLVTFSTKNSASNNITNFINTNKNVLFFSFSDVNNRFMADVDYRNFRITRDGTVIFAVSNGTTSNNKRAYTFAPVDSNGNVLTSLYREVDGELRFYYSENDYFVVGSDGYINMFDDNGVLLNLDNIRKKLTDSNGAVILFNFRVRIFDKNSPELSAISDNNVATGKIESKFEATVQFDGNYGDYEADGNNYFSHTYTIIVDRVKPQYNLNKLVLNELNAIVSKLYSGYTVQFIDNQYVVLDGQGNTVSDSNLATLISRITTRLNNGENLDYAFCLPNNFVFENVNENRESTYIYYRRIDNLNTYRMTTTPDDTDSYTFSLSSGIWTTLTYGENGLIGGIDGGAGYYEIVEQDQAGNYRVYVVYKGTSSPSYSYEYQEYEKTSSSTGLLTGTTTSNSIGGSLLRISNITASDLWQYVKVTIKSFKTLSTTLENAPTTIRLFNFAPSLETGDKNLSSLAAQLTSYINSQLSQSSVDGYLVTVEFYDRTTDTVYSLEYRKAGDPFNITINGVDDNQFEVIFDSDTANTTAVEIKAWIYRNGWVELNRDNSEFQNLINTTTRRYVFSKGLYKFSIKDNYGRETTLIHQIGMTDTLEVLPIDPISPYLSDGSTYYSFNNMSLIYQSNLREIFIQAKGYNLGAGAYWGSIVDGVIQLNLQNGTELYDANLANLYRSIDQKDGLVELQFFNDTTNFDVLVFTITLSYPDMPEEQSQEINIVYVNKVPSIVITDTEGNVISNNTTKFMEDVTISWPNMKVGNIIIPITGSITRSFRDEDGNSSTENFNADSSFLMNKSGTYHIGLNSYLGNGDSTQLTYLGGSILMYEVNAVDGSSTTNLSPSPQPGYIRVNGKNEPVKSYFIQKDFFVKYGEDRTIGKYLSVIANADEKLVADQLRSYYPGEDDYTADDTTISLSEDSSDLTYKIYKIHGEDGSTVFAEYLLIYYIDERSNFADIKINNSEDEKTIAQGNRFDDDSLTISWKAYNGMKKNTVFCDCYLDGTLIGTYYSTTEEVATVKLTKAGSYELVFRDLANNKQEFKVSETLKEKSLKFHLVNDVIFEVNGTTAIPNFITNNSVSLQILNTVLYTQEVSVTYVLNGKSRGTAPKGTNGYLFTEAGYYEVTMTTTVTPTIGDPRTITTKYNFIIIDPASALLCYDLPQSYNFNIVSLKRGNEDITYQLDSLKSLWLNSGDFGVGKYTITLNYTNPETNTISEFSYTVWINDEVPSLVCSIDWGTSTTKVIYLYFNPKLIYDMVGNSKILIDGVNDYIISADSVNEKVTIELKENRTYTVKLVSLDDRTICSYKVTKNEPLNTTAIIIISVGSALVVGLVIVFIVIRTRVKFR